MHDQTLVVAVQHQRPELSIILVQQLDAKLRSPYSSVLSDVFLDLIMQRQSHNTNPFRQTHML